MLTLYANLTNIDKGTTMLSLVATEESWKNKNIVLISILISQVSQNI